MHVEADPDQGQLDRRGLGRRRVQVPDVHQRRDDLVDRGQRLEREVPHEGHLDRPVPGLRRGGEHHRLGTGHGRPGEYGLSLLSKAAGRASAARPATPRTAQHEIPIGLVGHRRRSASRPRAGRTLRCGAVDAAGNSDWTPSGRSGWARTGADRPRAASAACSTGGCVDVQGRDDHDYRRRDRRHLGDRQLLVPDVGRQWHDLSRCQTPIMRPGGDIYHAREMARPVPGRRRGGQRHRLGVGNGRRREHRLPHLSYSMRVRGRTARIPWRRNRTARMAAPTSAVAVPTARNARPRATACDTGTSSRRK